MNLEFFKDRLGTDYSVLESYVNDLIGQRDAARKESQEGRKTLKAKVESLEAVKAKLFEKLGLDEESDLDHLPDAQGQAEAVKQFEARVKRLETELKSRTDALATLETKHRATRLDSELSQALNGHEFVDREMVAEYLRHRADWSEDQPYYRTEKGDLIPLVEGVANLAASRPHLLKTPGARGSGYNPNIQQHTSRPALRRLEFEALTPAARFEHVKAGGAVTD